MPARRRPGAATLRAWAVGLALAGLACAIFAALAAAHAGPFDSL